MNILTIDIGTSSMRGILFSDRGEKLKMRQVKYEPEKLSGGRIEQNPKDWIRSVERIASGIAKEAKKCGFSIDAVAVTAQRSSIIPIDRKGRPLMNTIMWQDRRNADLCRELESCNSLIFEKTGARLNTVFSGSRMTWIKRNCPEVCEKVFKFVNIPEYVMHHMTGLYVTDTTYGSRSHLMNLRKRKWDEQMLELFGIRKEELCSLQEPGTVAGRITAGFAEKTGILEGTPVITAGGDQQCAAIAQGAFQEGSLSLVAGTGGFLVAAVDEIPQDLSPQLICNCSSVRGYYMIEANVLTCCSAFDWYCQTFYDWERRGRQSKTEEKKERIDYDEINRELKEMDGWISTALVLPYFQGRSTPEWNPAARAVLADVSLNTDRKELLKGLLEGIFMEIQNNICLFADYMDIQKAYISGGMTNSAVINQIQSDIYGIPLCRMEDCEATALGALIIALEGLGVYPSVEASFKAVRKTTKTEEFLPRKQYYDAYAYKREQMNRMYRKIYQRCEPS